MGGFVDGWLCLTFNLSHIYKMVFGSQTILGVISSSDRKAEFSTEIKDHKKSCCQQ